MNTVPPSMLWVMARLITEAMIGPTRGVHTNPRLKPVSKPPGNLLIKKVTIKCHETITKEETLNKQPAGREGAEAWVRRCPG